MNQVTQIKKLRKGQYVVIIEGIKTETIIVTEDVLIKCNLLSPRTITDQELRTLKKENDDSMLYQKAIHFIDYQMRSISEVKKHLKKNTKDESKIKHLIDKLKDQGYLDDIRFTEQYVLEKMEYDLLGPKSIKQKLIDKGIHYDLIDTELIKYTDELQYQKIYTIIEKETKYKIKKPYKKVVESIKRKLVSKGFSLNIIDSSLTSYQDRIKQVCDEENMLQRDFEKLSSGVDISNFEQKDKIIKKLLQKGYSYQAIKNMF